MGSDAHLVVVGTDGCEFALAEVAQRRIEELERRWSRFVDDSEITQINRAAGAAVAVSADTVLLVERACSAWRLSGGAFDPTVLSAVEAAGYDRSFDRIDEVVETAQPRRPGLGFLVGCEDIEVRGATVRLPDGVGFDPGGIGKGLAADLIAAEIMAEGARGVCVNLGGDVRVAGTGPDGGGWTIDITHERQATPLAMVGLTDGAVATSTTLRRRWSRDGRTRHHLIDPRTGEPSTTDLDHVTVIAAEAWVAEVLAKAVLLRGATHPFDIVGGTGAQALIVTDRGEIRSTDGFGAFLSGAVLPDRLITTEET